MTQENSIETGSRIRCEDVLHECFELISKNLPFIAKAALIPVALAFLLDLISTFIRVRSRAGMIFDPETVARDLFLFFGESLFLLPLVAFVLFLIPWHRRLVKCNERSRVRPSFRHPFAAYSLYGLLAACCYFFPHVVVGFVWTKIFDLAFLSGVPIFLILGHSGGILLSSAICLTFPSLALGANVGLIGSWWMVRKDFWSVYLVFLTSMTPLLLVFLSGLLVVYWPALTSFLDDDRTLGAAIIDGMYLGILVAIPVMFIVAVVYSTCSTLIFQHLREDRDVR